MCVGFGILTAVLKSKVFLASGGRRGKASRQDIRRKLSITLKLSVLDCFSLPWHLAADHGSMQLIDVNQEVEGRSGPAPQCSCHAVKCVPISSSRGFWQGQGVLAAFAGHLAVLADAVLGCIGSAKHVHESVALTKMGSKGHVLWRRCTGTASAFPAGEKPVCVMCWSCSQGTAYCLAWAYTSPCLSRT